MKNKLTNMMIMAAAVVAIAAHALPARAAAIATLQSVKGKVEVRSGENASWAAAKKGMQVSEGMWIKTGQASEAVLRWQQGHIAKFTAFTTLKVTKMSSDSTAKQEDTELDISGGKVFVKTQKLASNKSTFKVRTPTAIAGVRGTDFAVEVGEDGSSKVMLLSGSLDIVGDVVETVLSDNMQLELPAVGAAASVEIEPTEIPDADRIELEGQFLEMEVPTPESAAPEGTSTEESIVSDEAAADNLANITEDILSNPELTTVPGTQEDLPPMPPER